MTYQSQPQASGTLDLQLSAVERELGKICGDMDDEKARYRLGHVIERLSSVRLAQHTLATDDQRHDLRASFALLSKVEIGGNVELCAVLDLSRGGALIETDEPLPVGAPVVLTVPEAGKIPATVLATSPRGTHLSFHDLSEDQDVAIIEAIKNRYAV